MSQPKTAPNVAQPSNGPAVQVGAVIPPAPKPEGSEPSKPGRKLRVFTGHLDDPFPQPEEPKFTEESRRRPDFAESQGLWLELADGQDWFFKVPRVRFVYEDGPIGFRLQSNVGPGFDAELNRSSISGDMRAAAIILRMSYELSPDDLAEILRFELDDEGTPDAVYESVKRVLQGIGRPKAN